MTYIVVGQGDATSATRSLGSLFWARGSSSPYTASSRLNLTMAHNGLKVTVFICNLTVSAFASTTVD